MIHSPFIRYVLLVTAFAVTRAMDASADDAQFLTGLGIREAAVPLRDTQGWRKPRKIVVAVDSADRLAWLQEVVADTNIVLVPARNPGELRERISDADALIGPCVTGAIESGAKLKWVQTSGVGVEDCVKIPAIHDGKIMLTNMPRITSSTVAEHAMGMVLALSRRLPLFMENQRQHQWTPRPPANLIALEGKTMLIVGLGGVGGEIAVRAHAFGMHIIAVRKEAGEKPPFVDRIGLPEELGNLLGQADFVVNATPLTDETAGMFNAQMFQRMRPTALFFNVGRGGSVVTDDLVNALKDGVIAGAGLDVVAPEPLPEDHPLWKMNNVLVTPHVGDVSELKSSRSWMLARENLRRYVAGGKLLGIVDAKRGY